MYPAGITDNDREKEREATELKVQSELQNATEAWGGITLLANYHGGNHNAIVMQREWLDFQHRGFDVARQAAIIVGN